MKTLAIYNSDSKAKMQEYINLAKELHADSQETADATSNELLVRCADESASCLRKAINADCEYTAYVNCNAVEIWNNKVNELLENL